MSQTSAGFSFDGRCGKSRTCGPSAEWGGVGLPPPQQTKQDMDAGFVALSRAWCAKAGGGPGDRVCEFVAFNAVMPPAPFNAKAGIGAELAVERLP